MLFRGSAAALAASATLAGAGGVAAASAERPTGVPSNTVAPFLTGTAAEHKKLKVLKGAWSGGSPLRYAYAWSRCNSAGDECQTLPGASKAAYQPVAGDVGHRLLATVTATNPEGATEASSAPSAIVAAGAPKHKGRPSISGEAVDGRILTAGDGVWKGTAPFTYTYQWERCGHGPCAPIDGATEKTYRAQTADITHKLRVIVIATNAAGSGKVLSKPSVTVVPGSPVNLVGPTISGVVLPGQTLSANDGTWVGTPPIAFTYQWLSCAPLGGGCTEIAGATEPTYTVGSGEIGDSFEVVVTATNAQGNATATSPETSITGGGVQPPVNVLAPSILGLAVTGQTLTANEGLWTGTEPAFTYQWELCDASGGSCAEIPGATKSTFPIPDGDAGHTLRVTVTASNAAGTASATSEHSLEILGVGPVNTETPSISGTATAGQILTASSGKWSGTEPILYEYEWLRCNATGGECAQAAAASLLPSYSVAAADVGHTLRVKVIAKNIAGTGSAESPATAEVGGVPPKNLIAPLIVGLTVTGQTVTTNEGTWTGTQLITYKFQWELCDASGASCSEIAGATKTSFTIPDGDAGHTLKVLVLAQNVAGSAEAISAASTEILGVGPKNTEPPKVTGTADAGQILTASSGKWSGTEPILYEYEWLRCNKAGAECTTAAAASLLGLTYTAVPADIGHTLKVKVIAKNVAGTGSAESAATGEVGGVPPSNVIAPLIVAAPVAGIVATATEGTWTGTEPITYAFQWIHCNNKGEACSEISGANKIQYTPTVAEIGKELKVKVTAKNIAGAVATESAATIPIVL